MEEFLQETELLDFGAESVQNLVNARGWKELPAFDKIKAVYHFVKDEIKFGFNKADNLSASKVLKNGYGQCNTKAILLAALLRAVDVPCRIHAYAVEKTLQKGVMAGIVYKNAPKNLLHSVVECFYGEKWVSLEGVILDGNYLSKLQTYYKSCTGAFCGFGVATEHFQAPNVEWNGEDTSIQSNAIVEDYGVYHSPDELYKERAQEMKGFKKFAYEFCGRFCMNRSVARIRNYKEKPQKAGKGETASERKPEEENTVDEK